VLLGGTFVNRNARRRRERGPHERGGPADCLSEAHENAGVPWIELVEDLVETVLETALATGTLPDPADILPTIRVLAHLNSGT
jgi:hypothetical protein